MHGVIDDVSKPSSSSPMSCHRHQQKYYFTLHQQVATVLYLSVCPMCARNNASVRHAATWKWRQNAIRRQRKRSCLMA